MVGSDYPTIPEWKLSYPSLRMVIRFFLSSHWRVFCNAGTDTAADLLSASGWHLVENWVIVPTSGWLLMSKWCIRVVEQCSSKATRHSSVRCSWHLRLTFVMARTDTAAGNFGGLYSIPLAFGRTILGFRFKIQTHIFNVCMVGVMTCYISIHYKVNY